MVYATSLAAELRKRRMQLGLKTNTTTSDAAPRPKISRSQNVIGDGSAEEPVIIIDDLSSPEDEVNPNEVMSAQMSLEPDAKKLKLSDSDVGAVDQQTLPAPIVDDTVLSSIPMPTQPRCVSAVTVEQKCSPAVAEEKLSPVPTLPQEQHSTPCDDQKTSPAAIDQNVTSSDALYAFRRLTELPMPPVAPDDKCESPSENNR